MSCLDGKSFDAASKDPAALRECARGAEGVLKEHDGDASFKEALRENLGVGRTTVVVQAPAVGDVAALRARVAELEKKVPRPNPIVEDYVLAGMSRANAEQLAGRGTAFYSMMVSRLRYRDDS